MLKHLVNFTITLINPLKKAHYPIFYSMKEAKNFEENHEYYMKHEIRTVIN